MKSVRPLPCLAGLVAASLLAPAAVRAQKLDKENKKWLDDVQPIILPEEEKTFRELKEKQDRDEFRKTFWARRDPDLETPQNEYQAAYEKARAEANTKFRVPGSLGANTDCGRVYILLGPPDEVERHASEEGGAMRGPETWTYRDRPGMTFKDGRIQISFDSECRLPQGARLGQQLNTLAEGKVMHPNLDYKKGADGRLVKLEVQLPKPSPATALLKTPRQDFTAAAEELLYLRGPQGSTYVAGLIRAEAAALPTQDVEGRKAVKAVVAVQAIDEAGKPSLVSERQVTGEPAADGSFAASYGVALKPGKYTLRAALLDPATGKGSVVARPVDIPTLGGTDGLVLPPLLILRDAAEVPAAADDPLGAFRLGQTRLEPRYGNVFKQSESILLSAFVYNPTLDPATGKPSFTMRWEIRSDVKPVAQAPAETYDQERGATVGPVSLANYAPGKYTAKVIVRDNAAQKDYFKETVFEVVP